VLRHIGDRGLIQISSNEDYDWSVRLNKITRTAYLPAMRATHHGGGAARKGMHHIGWFARSAVRFYNKNGWQWF
jgi:GT2 family glycosyltransferase